jgi:ferredoxin-like protein FixX
MSPRKIVCLIRRHQWEPKTNTFGSGEVRVTVSQCLRCGTIRKVA